MAHRRFGTTWKVSVPRRKRIEREGQHPSGVKFKSVSYENDGVDEAEVTLEIDVEAILRQIGGRAATNLTGVAKYLAGAIVVRRVGKRKEA